MSFFKTHNHNNSAVTTIVIAVLAFLVAVQAVAIVALMNSEKQPPNQEETVVSEMQFYDLYTIRMDNADLKYDINVANIRAEVEGNSATFLADGAEYQNMKLFTISLENDTDDRIGSILDRSGAEISISLKQYPYEGSVQVETVQQLNAIRDNLIDNIVSNLEFVDGPYQKIVQDSFLTDNMAIDTEYFQLYYPQKWEKYANIAVNGDSVEFYCCLDNREPIKLFTVRFYDDSTGFIGTVKDIPVAIVMETIEEGDGLSEEELEILYTMWEDSSIIIDGLVKYNGLVLS